MGKQSKQEKLWHKPLPLQLKGFRDKKNWTQEDLAERIGYSGASVVRIEAGEQNWTQEFLQRAAHALGCHWFDLLPLEGEKSRLRDLMKSLT